LTGPITQKELTKRLRELERSGLVHRQVYAEMPPRVEYRLTDLGGTLMPALEAFSAWTVSYESYPSQELSCPSVRFNARVGTGTEDACLWINGDGRVRT
jgi:DNA-binding HxlR family transcriptional regulator